MNMQAKGKSTVRLCNSGSSGLQHDVRDTILTSRFVKVDFFFSTAILFPVTTSDLRLCKRNLNTQRAESTDTTNLIPGVEKSYL